MPLPLLLRLLLPLPLPLRNQSSSLSSLSDIVAHEKGGLRVTLFDWKREENRTSLTFVWYSAFGS
jgi:hypothetical protein